MRLGRRWSERPSTSPSFDCSVPSSTFFGMDTLTRAERSHRMSLIRSKNTKPEVALRSMLHAQGYRFRIHRRDLAGSPDVVFPSRRKVIFVHGCFWHGHEGCKVANVPKTRTEYWQLKFAKNKARDRKNEDRLRDLGWNIMVVWECELREKSKLLKRVAAFLGPSKRAQ